MNLLPLTTMMTTAGETWGETSEDYLRDPEDVQGLNST